MMRVSFQCFLFLFFCGHAAVAQESFLNDKLFLTDEYISSSSETYAGIICKTGYDEAAAKTIFQANDISNSYKRLALEHFCGCEPVVQPWSFMVIDELSYNSFKIYSPQGFRSLWILGKATRSSIESAKKYK